MGDGGSTGRLRPHIWLQRHLQVFFSTTFFRLVEGADPTSVMPDLPAAPTIRDYREERDPLLQAALAYRAP